MGILYQNPECARGCNGAGALPQKEKQIYETAFIHNEPSEWEKCLARVSVHSVFMATTDTEKIASTQPEAILH